MGLTLPASPSNVSSRTGEGAANSRLGDLLDWGPRHASAVDA